MSEAKTSYVICYKHLAKLKRNSNLYIYLISDDSDVEMNSDSKTVSFKIKNRVKILLIFSKTRAIVKRITRIASQRGHIDIIHHNYLQCLRNLKKKRAKNVHR